MSIRVALILACLMLGLDGIAGVACGQAWPARPLRVIIPLSAGSAADIIPRVVFEQLSGQLGQPIIIENRPGASGTIGGRAVALAEPDGYTLLAHSSAHTIAPATVANLPYDPVKDFAAVAPLGSLPNVLVIAPSQNIRTVQDLVAAGKRRPITFGSTGVGSPIHLTMVRFRQSAGFEVQAIPFKGAPEALTEVMTGRIDVYFSPIVAALPFIRDGKLLALAVSSSTRASALPDVPTTLEAGYANSDYNFWIGVFAPALTPRDVVERLNGGIGTALAVPAVRTRLAGLGVEPMAMSTQEFEAHVRKEVAVNGELARAAGVTPN